MQHWSPATAASQVQRLDDVHAMLQNDDLEQRLAMVEEWRCVFPVVEEVLR